MKGDFSKRTDPRIIRKLNWSGVLHQQGKLLLDSDWNEQTGITLNWRDQSGRDIVGAGVAAIPVQVSNSFRILEESLELRSEGLTFKITPGRMWADGILIYLVKCRKKINNSKIERIALEQPHFPEKDSNRYAILLEVWREAINGFQIPELLLEPALDGVDTTERYQTAFAFRYLKLPEKKDERKKTCAEIFDVVEKIQGKKKGKLTVSFESVETADGECPIEGWSGYTGLENRLYRIEVAETDGAFPKFKWSNCNGGLVGRGDKEGDTIKITSNLQAIIDSGYQKFYMEFIQFNKNYGFWDTTFGAIVQLKEDNDLQVITTYLDKEPGSDNVFFRLWNDIVDVVDEKICLEYGICLDFDIGNWNNMRPGDFWTFPVRVKGKYHDTNNEFNVLPNMSEPYGIDYHLVPLAIATRRDEIWELTDCRVLFRPLTDQMNCNTRAHTSHEREFGERLGREKVDRLAFEEETKLRLEAEAAEKMEMERKKIEEETRKREERFEEMLEERFAAERATIEMEIITKIMAERRAKIPKLEDISGIGAERAKKLRELGLTYVEEFFAAPDNTIGEILGIREECIRKMKEDSVSLLIREPR